MKEILLPYLLAWLGMLVLAVVNGTIRDFGYPSSWPSEKAHRVSTLVLVTMFWVFGVWFVRHYPPKNVNLAWQMGVLWCVLTLLFEFGMGKKAGKSFNEMLEAYNIFKGNLWILVPLSTLLIPPVAFLLLMNGKGI